MPENIPRSDPEFDLLQSRILAQVEADATRLGLTDTNKSNFIALSAAWRTKYAADIVAQDAAKTASQEKRDAREALETEMRTAIKKIFANENLTDADLVAMGLNPKDKTRTRASRPSTIPIGRVDFSLHLQHKIHFVDSATPLKKKRPTGYRGVQIHMKIGGPPPVDTNECFYAGFDTNSPYLYTFNNSDLGKTVYYILIWENTRGETGNPSEIFSAVVG